MPRSLTVALLLCGALIAGCGGPAKGDGAKGRFIAGGDRICDKLGKRFERLAATRISQSPQETVRNAGRYRALTRELSEGLARLERPEGDAKAARLVDLSERLTLVARRQKLTAKAIASAVEHRDAALVQRRARAFNRVARGEQIKLATSFDRGMHAYGFKNCGRSA